MRRKRLFWFLGLTLLAAAGLLIAPRQSVQSQSVQPLTEDTVVSFLVRMGVTDAEPRDWSGTLNVSNGELIQIRDWHPRPENEIVGADSWKFSTLPGINFRWRPWEDPPPTGPQPYLRIPGVIVDVKASPGTRLNFRTESGRFSFNPREVPLGQPASMINGAVIVERVPPAEKMSTERYDDDFVSMLSGQNGEVWACWVAYRNNGSEVVLRRFDGSRWGEAQRATEKPGDIFLAKMGRDSQGRPWVVWSQQVNGNFDLYGRYLDEEWSAVERLTDAPQPDIFHNLATDSKGDLWLVWQGFRNGRSDVFARRFVEDAWSAPERLSTSSANDWEPVIATDKRGGVTVAWDTYNKGNYDIMMRHFSGEEWAEPEPIAQTPKYEAHISLAYDNDDRLWAAWNESGTNWGKDTGFVLNLEGTRLYEWRSIAVAVHDGQSWQVPIADINESLPEDLQEYNDFPILQEDAEGRMWLFARHRTLRIRDTHSETPAHRAAWEIWGSTLQGSRWTTPVRFPFTANRMDVRWGLASDGEGNLFAAWPTDNRDFDQFLYQNADVYAARIPSLPGTPEDAKLVARKFPDIPVFPIHTNEEEDLERIRGYEIQSEGKTYRIYRGDTHRHTEFSMDGNNDGSLFQTYRYSMDVAELDYLLVSEHNYSGGPDNEYINWLLQQFVDLLTVEDTFVPFYGYERSISYPDGHRNVLLPERGIPTLPVTQAQRQHQVGAEPLYEYLKRHDGIAISHTSATGMGTDWRDNDPVAEPLVELYQGDRVSAEYEGAPRAARRDNPNSAPGGFRPAGYVWNAWEKGYKLGVQVASDHLSTHISYACTIAEDFTREGMLDAMKKRHSYGATDNIILDYRMQADGKEYLQGDIVDVSGDFRLKVKVVGTTPIRQIDIIRNQSFVHNRQNLAQEVDFEYVDNNPEPGESFYYVRVLQNDEQIAWSSPIWVRR